MTSIRVGVDLGGTKIEAVALSSDGTIVVRQRSATPLGSYDGTVAAVASLVAEVEHQAGGRAAQVGVGTPGSLSPATGLIRNANSTALNGRPLNRDLEQALNRPVRLANDANCFALAEAKAGAGQGYALVFGVILGTGVGGGFVYDGDVLLGRNRIGGEWGHNPLPHPKLDEVPGPKCYCGRYGCIETWVSGPALAADHRREAGIEASPQEIVMLAAAGDMMARDTLDRHTDRLGRALAAVINIADPDVVVLGGGLSNLEHLYVELASAMRPHIFSDTFDTPVIKNALGDSAGVIGAAWLWPAETT